MMSAIPKIVSTSRMVYKRSRAHWRLLSFVVVGVLLASAIMAANVIYFDTLKQLALENTLAQRSEWDLDILVKAERGPTTPEEYSKVSAVLNSRASRFVGWMLEDRVRAGKSATFFLTESGKESIAGEDNARSYFAFLPRLEQHTSLVSGRVPAPEAISRPGEIPRIEARIPEDAAQLFGLSVGDRLSAVPHWEDAVPYLEVVVSGIFRKTDPDEAIWHMDEGVLKAATRSNFRTVPFFVSEETYMDVIGVSLPRLDSTYVWLLDVAPGRLKSANATIARQGIVVMEERLRSILSGYRQITILDEVLEEYDRRLFFTKLPMFLVLILIAVVVLYYVATISSLLVDQQRSEIALLRSRGASSRQVLTVYMMQGGMLCVLGVVAGPWLAAAAIGFLGFTPAFSGLSGSTWLPTEVSGGAYALSAVGGLLSFGALMIPAIQASRVGVTRQRHQGSRPDMQPAFQRYYLDVVLLIGGIILFRQLTEQGSLVVTRVFGEVGANQLLLAVPALVLLAAAMVLLRLFPLVMQLASRVLARWLPAGIVLGLWQMARNPTHYARLSLLLILMAGLGIFAASFSGTLEQSFEERVLYATGSDIRVESILQNSSGPTRPFKESYEAIDGVDEVATVFRGGGFDETKLVGESYEMLAVDAEDFNDIAWFRGDFSSGSMAELLESLEYPTPPQAIPLPDDARAISVMVRPDRPHSTVRVTARIQDSNDRYFAYELGRLGAGDWRLLETRLSRVGGFRGRLRLEPVWPLKLVSIAVEETNAQRRLTAGSILIDSIQVRTGDGLTKDVETFDSVDGWSLLKVTPDAASDDLRQVAIGANGPSGAARFSWTEGPALTSRGIFHGPPIEPMAVLASESFLRDTGHSKGQTIEVSVGGNRIPVRIVDTVDFFPTLDPYNERFLISDLSSLSALANLDASSRELKPNEAWLTADPLLDDRTELVNNLARRPFTGRRVYDRERLLELSRLDPLVKAGWRALLFLAFATVLSISCLGFLIHSYVSFKNREPQFALLRTMGITMRQLTALVWLEQALVIVAGMALGTWMGGRLGAIIMPFLGYDDRGSEILPPFIIHVEWSVLLITYAVMITVFGAIVTAMILFMRKISLQRILRLGEM